MNWNDPAGVEGDYSATANPLGTEEQHDGVTLRCQAAHENQILPLLFYWLPNIQILEPAWLKEKLVKTLEGYLAGSAATVTG